MGKMSKYSWIVMVIAGFALLTGCAQESQKAAPAEVVATASATDSSIIFKPGYYEDKNLGFSFTYPAVVFSVEVDKKIHEVVAREGAQRIPACTVRVLDMPAGYTLENIPEWIKKDLKKMYPASKRHKIIETNMIKLENGIDANYALLKWRYQGSIALLTAYISVFKDGKLITSNSTSVPGQPPVEQLTEWAKALKVTQ